MVTLRPLRLAAPALAAALLFEPALRLVCDAICAQPPAPAAAHCAGGDPSHPAHGNPSGEDSQPSGCRHSADVVLAKASRGLDGAGGISLPAAELGFPFAPEAPSSGGSCARAHRRPPPAASPGAAAVLRL